MFRNIVGNINTKIDLTQDEKTILESHFEVKKIKKKELLLQKGEICNFEAYINKGCLRKYYIDDDGHELILQFAVEDWWIGDLTSFQEQKPSKLYIEALEDSELFILTPESKENLLRELPKLERFFRLLLQKSVVAGQDRLINTVSKNGEEKYLEFLKLYPTIPQRVPQLLIASYLGISPEFLSKIRSRILKKQ